MLISCLLPPRSGPPKPACSAFRVPPWVESPEGIPSEPEGGTGRQGVLRTCGKGTSVPLTAGLDRAAPMAPRTFWGDFVAPLVQVLVVGMLGRLGSNLAVLAILAVLDLLRTLLPATEYEYPPAFPYV